MSASRAQVRQTLLLGKLYSKKKKKKRQGHKHNKGLAQGPPHDELCIQCGVHQCHGTARMQTQAQVTYLMALLMQAPGTCRPGTSNMINNVTKVLRSHPQPLHATGHYKSQGHQEEIQVFWPDKTTRSGMHS